MLEGGALSLGEPSAEEGLPKEVCQGYRHVDRGKDGRWGALVS